MKKPKVICICGSTRFADLHAIKKWELEQQGNIVLMISYLPEWYAKECGFKGNSHFAEQKGIDKDLDQLHFWKIDISDEIFVINYVGYIGESTRKEINYAENKGILVKYLEPIK